MKKFFGVLSLIAVLTVAFSSNAIASDVDDGVNVEYVASLNSPDFVAVVANVPILSGVFNVYTVGIDLRSADVSVNNIAKGEVVNSADIVSRVFVNTLVTNYAKVFLPIEVGLSSANSNNKVPNLNEYVSNYNYKYGYEAPELVKRISANIGKLTSVPIRS